MSKRIDLKIQIFFSKFIFFSLQSKTYFIFLITVHYPIHRFKNNNKIIHKRKYWYCKPHSFSTLVFKDRSIHHYNNLYIHSINKTNYLTKNQSASCLRTRHLTFPVSCPDHQRKIAQTPSLCSLLIIKKE